MYTGLCHQFYYTGWGSQVLPDIYRETHVNRFVPTVLQHRVELSSLPLHLYRDSCIQDCAISSTTPGTGIHVYRTTLGGAVKSNLTFVQGLMYKGLAISSTTLGGAVKSYLTSVERLMFTGLCHQFYYTGWGSQVLPDVCRETYVYRTVPSVLLHWVEQSSLTLRL
ncbi:hypothetical protein DPMN_099429 [Dreissena polymorpha]|uniref:Uncharacterized protein n=1 Tax=Dreissena polymorpha TaxID=45954 RepID=A0A9D4LFG1_DREPO|nr:hypothetical protein DPMN_099429 [Dreissena polymorpha]